MIDHQYSMTCKGSPQAATNGETVTPLTDPSTTPDPLTAKQNLKKWSATCTPKYLFESRGAAALKAALKERNKLKISQLPTTQPVPPSLYEQKALRLAQRLKERKRSPKNNVLFTDPVVTKHYEYEPEYDGYVRYESSPAHNPVALQQEASGPNESQVTKVENPPLQQQALQDQKMEVNKTKHSVVNSPIDDDDDDDELYTLAPSDEMDLHADKILQINKASKRLRDSAEELEEERLTKSNSASGGLFSSPKVAKIAPYFEVDDLSEENRKRAILHNRYKQASANHRSRNIAHTQNEGQQSGYLGWLSTFLSNQLNKLIF